MSHDVTNMRRSSWQQDFYTNFFGKGRQLAIVVVDGFLHHTKNIMFGMAVVLSFSVSCSCPKSLACL